MLPHRVFHVRSGAVRACSSEEMGPPGIGVAPQNKRPHMVDRKNSASPQVAIINYEATGTGLKSMCNKDPFQPLSTVVTHQPPTPNCQKPTVGFEWDCTSPSFCF